jgi:hypothetical protein
MNTTTAPAAQAFDILRNDRTSYYEIHVSGCRHQIAAHMEHMVTKTAESAAALSSWFDAGNDGCLSKLGPCARKA